MIYLLMTLAFPGVKFVTDVMCCPSYSLEGLVAVQQFMPSTAQFVRQQIVLLCNNY